MRMLQWEALEPRQARKESPKNAQNLKARLESRN
jgi:hypothetical protein